MPSPRSSRERRSGSSGSLSSSNRLEFLSLVSQRSPGAPDSPARRKESGSGSAASPLPEEDCMKLNPSFLGIALSSLLAIDLWTSKRLGVCAGEGSAWGSARPLMKVIEVSGHGIPWLLGTFYGLCQSQSSAAREVLLNLLFALLLAASGWGSGTAPGLRAAGAGIEDVLLLEQAMDECQPTCCSHGKRRLLSASFALLLDLVLVAVVKGLVRRPRPPHNQMDMFATISVDKYSFPSGHATRAALVCRFVLHHLVLAAPLRVLVVLWALLVGVSRVMLGRHNVTDVLSGLLLGYLLYSVVEHCWLSPLSTPALFALWSH
ncbi:polyisoprenoid diphosphate/phosphate phosphohydrolase PLPP6 isoform X1 [Heliangelus exortis]|uniref:polyisoprenoid diphosphate/phosphate phosphohydrolase PLPP6 isoform X1 n=1 Tax=Heliangelus exortis TaxID=472823 RepID=UPI003A8DBA78